MIEEETGNFNSINHRSIESATKTDLVINFSNVNNKSKILLIFGIIFVIIGSLSIIMLEGKKQFCGSLFLFIGGIFIIIGIYFLITIKYKFEFSFQGQKLILKKTSCLCSNDQTQYFISKLDYIIIDQMHVENDEEGRENALSIGSEQNKIPSKIIINSIDEGFEEIFNGSGNPPLFTNDEVQFFNQFMRNNIDRIRNES